MKKILLVLVFAAAVFAACAKQEAPAPAPAAPEAGAAAPAAPAQPAAPVKK